MIIKYSHEYEVKVFTLKARILKSHTYFNQYEYDMQPEKCNILRKFWIIDFKRILLPLFGLGRF